MHTERERQRRRRRLAEFLHKRRGHWPIIAVTHQIYLGESERERLLR
eukprot:COSAG01_NODE_7201_length_3306_cov_59.287496_5_plen_46_part_01